MRKLRILLAALLSFSFAACSSTKIIRDREYSLPQKYFQIGDFKTALATFPKKESNGFITTLEKNWIRLWDDQADAPELLDLSHQLDERKVIKISEEAATFFMRETEEGYFPSEHEVIVLHLVTAMAFLDHKDFKTARIEIKKASEIFNENYNGKEEIFDDPALRLWLATLWVSIGEWNEAQVDLRRIYEMTKNKEALKWSESNKPPREWHLALSGNGATLSWEPEATQPSFDFESAPLAKSELQFSTEPWLSWHLKRNYEAREFFLKSNYMAQYAGIKSRKGLVKTMGYTAGGTMMLIGVGIGVAAIGGAIYLASMATSSASGEAVAYLAAGGIALGGFVISEGNSVVKQADKKAEDEEKDDFKNMQNYRFVRFLPRRIGWVPSIPAGVTKRYQQYPLSTLTSITLIPDP